MEGNEIRGMATAARGSRIPLRYIRTMLASKDRDGLVLSRFATAAGLKLAVTVDVDPPGGMTMSKVEKTKVALCELGMPEDVSIKRGALS